VLAGCMLSARDRLRGLLPQVDELLRGADPSRSAALQRIRSVIAGQADALRMALKGRGA
jgi:hypothetical protein